MKLSLESLIESILFFKAEPLSIKELSALLEKNESEVDEAVQKLAQSLENRGVVLVRNGKEIMLETAGEAGEIIEKMVKDELSKEIGKAGLEVLSLVLYRSPISKSEIDYIRGVNSSYILRNLMIRGLVERSDERGKDRSYVYKPTFELLSHLGIKDISELPEFADVKNEINIIKEEVIKTESMDSVGEFN